MSWGLFQFLLERDYNDNFVKNKITEQNIVIKLT